MSDCNVAINSALRKVFGFSTWQVFAFFVWRLVLNPSTKYLKQLRIIFLPNSNPTQTQYYILSHYLRIVLVYAAWMFLFTTCVTNKSTVYRNHKQFVKRPTKTYYCEIFLLLLDPLLPGFTVPLTEIWLNRNFYLDALLRRCSLNRATQRDTIMSSDNVF